VEVVAVVLAVIGGALAARWWARRVVHVDASLPVLDAVPTVLTAGIAAGAMVASLGAVWVAIAFAHLAAVLAVACLVDVKVRRLPDAVVVPGIVIGALLLVGGALADGNGSALGQAALGAALVGAVLFALHLISPAGLGFGDVKLGVLLGLHTGYLGVQVAFVGLALGAVIGALVGVAVAVGTRDRRATFAFGPALALGAVLVVVLHS
jgi:leader peptidase (prepilin peptidase)/N-methyltransferase